MFQFTGFPSIRYGLAYGYLEVIQVGFPIRIPALIIGAGHITKMWALVYAPLMMGGAWMTLRGNMWAGGALTAI